MALSLGLAVPTSFYSSTWLPSRISASQGSVHGRVLRTFRCLAVTMQTFEQKIVRRSANYEAPIWDYDYVQSLNSKYAGGAYAKQAVKLKEDIRIMLEKVADPLVGLEMIDDLQRLGVFYQFEEEINSLGKALLAGVFNHFKDESGDFKACLGEDIKGMLYLYEASFLSVEGESTLEEAREFAAKNLRQSLKRKDIHHYLAMLVSHALELPLHYRVPRLEARWFIDVYERRADMNPTLLQLAKLITTWCKQLTKEISSICQCLGEKLSFARDRLMECFLWTVGMDFKPQFVYRRKAATIVNALITTIDDVYDVYGTLDELELFTNAVERWDITAMEQLPAYMKICFLALFNSINEIGYYTLKDQGVHCIPYLQKMWADLCKCYLVEARWYYSGYTPTFEEYMNNAWISISGPVMLTHAYFLSTSPITMEGLEWLEKYPNIIRWSATILRLADDLGTSSDEMKKGDIPKSIQCHMHETGASEEEAREHIKYLIGETWKKMNKDQGVESPCSQTFVELAMNLGRMAQCMYQDGDGHAAQGVETKNRVLSLLINPVPLDN
ncbi:hypothetical protein Vadar_033306 [Vaccinium darrowii]|uniref:Uncharacterized protein n=1 Tax=Vaccinium darrowii TaxID=229202 RepID=A0ACB7YTK3_9ERIC|nr:hypothetical protein Vadar_033306 [Vaccinium darrowii]